MVEINDCDLCGREDDYMVTDETWSEAGLADEAICCRICLEGRIGRPLVATDYEWPVEIVDNKRKVLDSAGCY